MDRKVFSSLAVCDGTFVFCPVPLGNYDVVVAGQTTSGVVTTTYKATIVFGRAGGDCGW